MPYMIRMGTGSIVAMILFIPLLIMMTIVLPALIIVILSMAVAVGVGSVLISKAKQLGKKKESSKKEKGIIDVDYKIK